MTSTRSERISDAVSRWHNTTEARSLGIQIHEYLGWTSEEYRWYAERGVLPPERPGAF